MQVGITGDPTVVIRNAGVPAIEAREEILAL